MNELIKVTANTIGFGSVQTVNARELHGFLGSKIRFNDWIRKRIADYGFQESIDFTKVPLPAGFKMAENGGDIGGIGNAQKNVAVESMGYDSFGQQGRIEYAISLDMAKELAMVERNEKGKQARQYFIECERLAKQPAVDPVKVLGDPSAMRGLLLSYCEKVIELQEKNAALSSKADSLDRIASADGSMCVTNAAKHLQMRPKDLFAWLQSQKWIYRRNGGAGYLAYQDRIQQHLLEHKVTTVSRSDGSEKVVEQVLITGKGLARLAEQVARQPRLVA